MLGGAHEATSNMILVNENDSSSDMLEAVLVSCSTSELQVMEDPAMAGGIRKRDYYAPGAGCVVETSEETYDDVDVIDDVCAHQADKKRRLSAEQVKSLERSFETKNKLEPDRKLQLARDLNLQPRQVAVWFQNRRARWKTKQLEKDYIVLKGNYELLKAEYDSLREEREELQVEVNSLRSKLQQNVDESKVGESLNSPQLNVAQEKDAVSVNKLQVDSMSCLTKVEPSLSSLKDYYSSGSNPATAATIPDASSPQPIDSGLSDVRHKITSLSTVDEPEITQSGEVGMSNNTKASLVAPYGCHQFLMKPQDDSLEEDETYRKYLYTIVDDDQGPFAWWNWP